MFSVILKGFILHSIHDRLAVDQEGTKVISEEALVLFCTHLPTTHYQAVHLQRLLLSVASVTNSGSHSWCLKEGLLSCVCTQVSVTMVLT